MLQLDIRAPNQNINTLVYVAAARVTESRASHLSALVEF